MKIIQTYVDQPDKPQIISVERFIELTEGRGFYLEGTALSTLIENGTLRTDFSYFKMEGD